MYVEAAGGTLRRPSAIAPFVGSALAALACACGAPPLAEPPRAEPPRPAPAQTTLFPARWLVPDGSWIERSQDGLDRVISNGRRLELDGLAVKSAAAVEPDVEGGAAAPPWAASGPHRYVFWKGRDLYSSPSFTGPLTKLHSLSAPVRGSFDWLSGVGLLLQGGVVTVAPANGAVLGIGVPGAAIAVAANDKRALVSTLIGHALLTVDGGAHYRDVSDEVGLARRLDVRGDHIVALLHGGGERTVDAAGRVTEARAEGVSKRSKPKPDVPDRWPDGAAAALRAAVERGAPTPDGGAVIAGQGLLGRFDLTTLRTTSSGRVPTADGECSVVRVEDTTLAFCVSDTNATVLDVTGTVRVERTFDLSAAPDLDRFVASPHGAAAFIGPCEGPFPPIPEIDRSEGGNTSMQRSPVVCVRARRDEWVERRVGAVDADDVLAWVPRRGGDAIALVARPGTLLDDHERAEDIGPVRVLRVARSEPPLSLPTWASRGATRVNMALYVADDGAIEGMLPSAGHMGSATPVHIDARGHVRAYALPPRAQQIVSAGRFALATTEDGRFFETTSGGRRWIEVEPPPIGKTTPNLWGCSPVGCRVGDFVRVGWSTPEDGSAPPALPASERVTRDRYGRYQRPAPPPPIIELHCSLSAPAEGKRNAEVYHFGYMPTPRPRGAMPTRLGSIGAAILPWNGPQLTAGGDVELAWVPPLDLAAPIHRATISLARAGVSTNMRVYEMRVGYLLNERGGLDVIPVGYRDQCMAPVLDLAGISRPIGGCIEDRAVGVEASGKLYFVQPLREGFAVHMAFAKRERGSAAGALRELAKTETGLTTRGFALGAGVRGGAPFVVVVDAIGGASLVPIDPERGTLGKEETLKPLTAALVGSDKGCSGASPGEVRVALSFDSEIGMSRASMPTLSNTGTTGIAVVRWSSTRVCVDAVEINVRDERYDDNLSPYDPAGTLRKVIARLNGAKKGAEATLLLVGLGSEIRQRLSCSGFTAVSR